MSRIIKDNAVSTIVGAFILVLIVVSAATGFAVYISETQKNTVQMGTTMVEYGLEELIIASTYDSMSFEGWNNTEETYHGVGLLLTNPGIRDIKVQGFLIDGTYVTKGNLFLLDDRMVLYNYSFDLQFGGFKAFGKRIHGQNWSNISSQNKTFIFPQSSITRLLLTDDLLTGNFSIDVSLPTHVLEIISARGRYFTTTFAYP